MNKTLLPRDDINWMDVSKKKDEEYTLKLNIGLMRQFEDHIKFFFKRPITEASDSTVKIRTNIITETRKQK